MATKFTLLLFAIKIRLSCNQNKNFCFSTSGVNKGGARGGFAPPDFLPIQKGKRKKGEKEGKGEKRKRRKKERKKEKRKRKGEKRKRKNNKITEYR